MKTTAQRLQVPAGFSGWWCTRCAAAVENIPDEIDAAQTKCPTCHKWTAYWIPGGNVEMGMMNDEGKPKRQPAGRALESEMAGPGWERKRPRDEDARRLFEHVRNVIENPDLEPDLRKLDDEAARS
jgi:hypothetical protein